MKHNIFKTLRGKRVLVTGGAGFIGSNVCQTLLDVGSEVACMDNLATGHQRNIEHLLPHPSFKFLLGDIRDLKTCQDAMEGCDYVLHQAALGSVPRSVENPITTNEVNVSGFLNMLVAAKEADIKRFVYAASSSTYGDSKELPKIEENIGKPLSPYAITKYVNELYAENFGALYGLNTIGLRYFNVFGSAQDPDGAYAAVMPKFIKALINKQSPQIHGDGEQSRDFTYIENVVQVNLLSLVTESKLALGEVYNVACEDRTTINQIFFKLRELLSKYDPDISKVEPEYVAPRVGDVKDSLASVSKAKRLLGYNPSKKVQEGLTEAIDWYWNFFKGQTANETIEQ